MFKDALKKIFRWTWLAVKLFLLVLAVFFASLFFREQKLPSFLVDRIASACSTTEFLVRCDSVSFGFRHGLRFAGVRLYDLRRPDSLERPVGSARFVLADWFRRAVRVVDAEYHRLPDSYYEENTTPAEPSPVVFDIPEVDEFLLELENPRILGIDAEFASGRVSMRPGRILLDSVKIVLPDRDCRVSIDGDLEVDLDLQRIKTDLRGFVKQAQIRPLLEVLDLKSVLPYVDAFTEIPDPIPSRMSLRADLTTKDLALKLNFSPESGKYNSVPLEKAEGGVEFETFHDKERIKTKTRVFLPSATDRKGRHLSGWLAIDDFSGKYRIDINARSELDLEDAISVAGIDYASAVDGIRCETPPSVTVKGTLATDVSDCAANNISGVFSCLHASAGGFSLNDTIAEYSLKKDVLDVDFRAAGKTGGRISASSRFDFEGFGADTGRYEMRASYTGGSLEELADLFTFDLGDRHGRVNWTFDMSGGIGDESLRSLNGKGRFQVSDGHLAQMKLFAGLTALLAEKIPGVSFLVNQTQASCNYTIRDGVFASDDIFIEGGLISIKGWGKYDIPADNLDFTVRVQFIKNDTLVGKIVHPVTFPITMFLEYKVRGSIDDPQWNYIKILDKVF